MDQSDTEILVTEPRGVMVQPKSWKESQTSVPLLAVPSLHCSGSKRRPERLRGRLDEYQGVWSVKE